MIVDIEVRGSQIKAFKPEIQTFCGNDDFTKSIFLETGHPDRMSKRESGCLKDNALKKASRIVNKYGAINMNGFYGSIEIDQNDFVSE